MRRLKLLKSDMKVGTLLPTSLKWKDYINYEQPHTNKLDNLETHQLPKLIQEGCTHDGGTGQRGHLWSPPTYTRGEHLQVMRLTLEGPEGRQSRPATAQDKGKAAPRRVEGVRQDWSGSNPPPAPAHKWEGARWGGVRDKALHPAWCLTLGICNRNLSFLDIWLWKSAALNSRRAGGLWEAKSLPLEGRCAVWIRDTKLKHQFEKCFGYTWRRFSDWHWMYARVVGICGSSLKEGMADANFLPNLQLCWLDTWGSQFWHSTSTVHL